MELIEEWGIYCLVDRRPHVSPPAELSSGYYQRATSLERGSALPMLIGTLLMALSAYMVATNIYFLNVEKMKLERWGEIFITDLYQEIAYEEYYFTAYEPSSKELRNYVEVDCSKLLLDMREKSRTFPPAKSVESASCNLGRVKLVLSKEVQLPFIPQGFVNFRPKVVAHVEAGLQRVRTNG